MNKNTSAAVEKSARSNFGAWGWFTVIFAFLSFMFAGNLILDSLNITLAAFNQLHGWETGILLSYSTIAGLIAIVGMMFLGWWIDKSGVRVVYTACFAIVAISCFVCGRITEPWHYLIIVILVNIFGNGFGFMAGATLIANWFPKKKGLAMGWATIGFQASGVALLPIFTMILNKSGLVVAYDMLGICLVVMTVICILFVRDNPEDRNCAPDNDKSRSIEEFHKLHAEALAYQKNSPWTIKKLLKTKQVWQVGIIMGLVQMSVTGLISQFIPKMMEVGFDQPMALTIYSVASIIGGVGSYLWGVVDQKLGTKKTTIWMGFTHALAAVACALAGTVIFGNWWMYFSALLVAVNIGVSSNLVGSLTATIFGRYDFARAYTPIIIINSAIRCLSFATTGVLYTMTGSYTMPYLAAGAVALIAMIMTFFVDDRCIGRVE